MPDPPYRGMARDYEEGDSELSPGTGILHRGCEADRRACLIPGGVEGIYLRTLLVNQDDLLCYSIGDDRA